MMTANQETKELKKVLKAAGYPVISCAHGRGTAYGWINIVIDDYDRKIVNGHKIRQYEEIKKIAYQVTNDDRQCVEFTKQHTCAECLVYDSCDKYHTKEMGSCGGFFNQELADLQEQEHQKYLADLEFKKNNPIKIEVSGDFVTVQNIAVNCGATFEITKTQYDQFISEGKNPGQIFDHLAYEEQLEIKAEQYRKECEANREKAGHPWVYDGYGNRDNYGGPLPDAMIKDLDPHGIKEITITRAEGPIALCDKPKYFDSWQSANSWLVSQSFTFPKGGCYDKHDFKIVFNDGQDYNGRLDCKHHSEPDNDLNLFTHIKEFCEFHAGRREILPAHITKEQYAQMINRFGAETVRAQGEFIDKYLLSAVI